MKKYDTKDLTEALRLAFMHVVFNERLSQEASVEELCKILLIKLSYERTTQTTLTVSDADDVAREDTAESFYYGLFSSYVPFDQYYGWNHIDVKLKTFCEVLNILQPYNFSEEEKFETGRAFTMFLQYSINWDVYDYSTPSVLTNYIFKILDLKDVYSLYDPCCGIGGMLTTAYIQKKGHLNLYGNDISQSMANISRLHLQFYGCEGEDFTTYDYTDISKSVYMQGYDCIVAQLPTRRQSFSVAGKTKKEYEGQKLDYDFIFIKNIIYQLHIGGVAAIIVPDSVIEDYAKKHIRDYIYLNAEVLNITRCENVVTQSNYHKLSYYILFLRKSFSVTRRYTTATYIGADTSAKDISEAIALIKNSIYQKDDFTDNRICKKYGISESSNWKISLLFIRDKIGNEFEPVMLGDILDIRRERERIDPEKEYQVLRVRRRGMGVDVKKVVQGSVIMENMYRVKANDLVVSAFEADMGGIGFVPRNLDGSIVTKNIYLFEVDKNRVDLNYLFLTLTSEPVLEQLQEMNKRSYALSRISISNFLSVMIPLPDLPTQKIMAKMLQRYIDKVQRAEEELTEGRKNFNKMLFGKE